MKLAKKNLSSEKQEVALLFNKEGGESISGLTSENDTDYLCRGHHKVILDSSQILVKMSNPTGSFECLFEETSLPPSCASASASASFTKPTKLELFDSFSIPK